MFLRYIPPTVDRRLAFDLALDDSGEEDPSENRLERVAVQLSEIPISTFSTLDGPNASGFTSPGKGQIGIETGSSSTLLWVASAPGTGNWSALSHI